MADFLLLGDPGHLLSFVAVARPGHTWWTLTDEPERFEADGPIRVVGAGESLPVDLSAVFELSTTDTGERHANLAAAVDAVSGDPPLFCNVLTTTATAVSALIGDRFPVVGISFVPALFAASTVIEAAPALQTSSARFEAALDVLRGVVDKPTEVVEDRMGLVSARVLVMIVNEAAFAFMEGVADPSDIDTAMKLGTNYPHGPLEWADRIGLDLVVGLLQALYDEYGEERYRPCVLLRQYARAARTFHPVTGV